MITPTATPASFDASNLIFGGTTDIDLLAGPAGTAAYLAPDGEHFAYLTRDSLCIYLGDQQQTCNDELGRLGGVDEESVRWSPDSRYLTLATNFYISFHEPDIWVIDASSGALTDITDDGVTHLDFGTDWHNLDLFPCWTEDGQIIFLRMSRVSTGVVLPEIHRIAPDGSGDTVLGTLPVNDLFAVFAMDVKQDKLAYSYAANDLSNPNNGVWISNLDGSDARQIKRPAEGTVFSSVELSPDGCCVLVTVESYGINTDTSPQSSRAQVIDVQSGKQRLIDPDRFVAFAGWSPEGSALIYVTSDPVQHVEGVYLTDRVGQAGTKLLDGRFNVATPRQRQPLGWGANNHILLSRSPDTGIVLLHLSG